MSQRSFLPRSEAVREARQFGSDAFVDWGFDLAEGVLILSELAANAVVHGRSPFSVILKRTDHHVLIEVSDKSPEWPVLRPASDDEGGRGLAIVTRVARSWGCLPDLHGGKTVWAEVAVR